MEEAKSIEDINATQSVNADYSQLLSQKQYPQNQAEQYSFKTSPRYSCKDLYESRSIVDTFLMKDKPKKKVQGHKVKVFARLHNQAIVMQKKKLDLQAKNKKRLSKNTNKIYTLGHSKSGYLKDQSLHTDNYSCKKAKKHAHTKTKKELEYDANFGQRLYLKNRGLSNKRDQSLRKIRRRKSMKEIKNTADMCKQSLVSPNSQWILDEKKYGETFCSESTWNKKELAQSIRYY